MSKGKSKRTVTPALKAAQFANLAKARAQRIHDPKCRAASQNNAKKAASVRSARSILKHLPVTCRTGDTVKAGTHRIMKVIDEKPFRDQSGKWIQRFEQSGHFSAYGITREFTGIVRIVWDYEPTAENILDSPMLEEENQENEREKTAVFDQRPLSAERE